MIKPSLRLTMTDSKRNQLIFICFMLCHGFAELLNCTNPTPESLVDALEKDVFPKKLVRPAKSFLNPINITISINVVGIVGVNEKAQTLTTVLLESLEWDIEGLSWDVQECGTKRISLPRDKFWVPDIHVAEFMDEDRAPKLPYIYLYHTGHILDDKPLRVISSCRLDIYTFPFDIQNCTLSFGPFLHFSSDIKMVQGADAEYIMTESQKLLQTNGEWELIGILVVPVLLAVDHGSYSKIEYCLYLRRRPLLYVVNLLIPSSLLVTVDLVSFLLPPQSVDRSSFKMTLILGYTVFLLIMNDLLPATGNSTPLINVFFSISLALMVASLLETLCITNILNTSSNPVPRWLNVLVLRYIAAAVCFPREENSSRTTVVMNPFTDQAKNPGITLSAFHLQGDPSDAPPEKPSAEPHVEALRKLSRDLWAIRLHMDKHFQERKAAQEWEMIGQVMDRLLFALYILFIIVSFITIISVWFKSATYTMI